MAINFSKDYYALLETESFADLQTLRKSYYRLAKKYHPDRNPWDEAAVEKFKEIAEAYAFLSDPYYKALYDECWKKGSSYRQDDDEYFTEPAASYPYEAQQGSTDEKGIGLRLFYVAFILLFMFRNSCNNKTKVHSFESAKIFFDSVQRRDTVIFHGLDSVHIYQKKSPVFKPKPAP